MLHGQTSFTKYSHKVFMSQRICAENVNTASTSCKIFILKLKDGTLHYNSLLNLCKHTRSLCEKLLQSAHFKSLSILHHHSDCVEYLYCVASCLWIFVCFCFNVKYLSPVHMNIMYCTYFANIPL